MTRDLCDHCQLNGQTLHLETGQETADGLLQFLADVQRDNLFVNFDPANMILYGTGEPIEALQKIASACPQCALQRRPVGGEPRRRMGAGGAVGGRPSRYRALPAHASNRSATTVR